MKFIDWVRNHKTYTVLAVVGIVLIPIVIVNILFKIPAPVDWLVSEFGAGDVLSYIAAIVGAAATIGAIMLTISFTRENQKSERKLSVKPYLQTAYYPADREKAAQQVDHNAVFITYPYGTAKTIANQVDLPNVLKVDNSEPVRAVLDAISFSKDMHIMIYSVTNVGAGNAVNITFTLDSMLCLTPFSLAVKQAKVFVFLLKSSLLVGKEHTLLFNFNYHDVASLACYEQSERITLYADDNGFLSTKGPVNDLISIPKEV